MKRGFLLVALCGLLSACVTVPVAIQTEKGESFHGELNGSLFGQTIHLVSKKGVECNLSITNGMATTKIMDMACSDGRQGKVTVSINRDSDNPHNGWGTGFMSDGTQFTFTSGDRVQNSSQGQVSIRNHQQIGGVRDACNKSTAQEQNPHEAAVVCKFTAYEDLLKKSGFQDMDVLNVLKSDYLDIAKRQDSKLITGKQADALYHQATKKFDHFVAMRDDARSQAHQETMATAAALIALGNQMEQLAQQNKQARADAYRSETASNQSTIQMGNQMVQQAQQEQQAEQQRQQMEQQRQAQQQRDEQNRLNARSPGEKLNDCSNAGGCAGVFAPAPTPVPYDPLDVTPVQ
jgi:hypothetical protein